MYQARMNTMLDPQDFVDRQIANYGVQNSLWCDIFNKYKEKLQMFQNYSKAYKNIFSEINENTGIFQITFKDNTYQSVHQYSPLIYSITQAQANANLGLQYIEYDQNQDSIITILSNNTGFTETQVITLFNSSNFSDSTKVVSTDLDISQAQSTTYFKQAITLFNNLSATLRWTPITSDIPISQFCISKVNDNELYTIRTTDNAIYKSVLNNNALTSTLFDNSKFSPQSFVIKTPKFVLIIFGFPLIIKPFLKLIIKLIKLR
jgi:hypothetical protein